MNYTVHGILQTRILERVAFLSSRGSSQSRDQTPGVPHCRWILYQLSHKGKSKNTGVGSLSLLQWIFPTQEFYQGLLHCRQILYQLSSQGSPWTINVMMSWWTLKPHIYSYKTILCVCVLVTKLCPTLVTQWTVAHQSSLSMGFSRQEYWSGLLFPSPDNIILAANFKVMLVLFYLVSKNSLCKIKKPMNWKKNKIK